MNHYQGKEVKLPSAEEIARAFRGADAKSAWRWLKGRARVHVYTRKAGQDFYNEVRSLVGRFAPYEGPVRIDLEYYPPDNRRRDFDNLFKCVLDSLEYASVVKNDAQFKRGSWTSFEPRPGGEVYAEITPIDDGPVQLEL